MNNSFLLTLLFIFYFAFPCLSQIPESVIPNFSNLKKPLCQEFKVVKSKPREFTCSLDQLTIRVIIPSDEYAPARFVITEENQVVYDNKSYVSMTNAYSPKVYLCDINQDGCNDILMVSYDHSLHVGESLGSDSPIIHSFLRFADKPICYNEMSSIGGSVDLFRQYKNDGQFQFACIKFLGRPDNGKGPAHFAINIFEFDDCGIRNVTRSVPGFPIYFKMNEATPNRSFETLKDIPVEFRENSGEMTNANSWDRDF